MDVYRLFFPEAQFTDYSARSDHLVGVQSVRRSFNGPTKRHINGPAIDGGSSCPKGGFHDSEEKSILSQALLKRRSFYEVEPGPNKTNSGVPGAGNIHQKDCHSLPGWPQHSEEIPKKFAS